MRRLVALALVPVILGAGLGVHASSAGWASPAGDALYAVLFYLLVVAVFPRRRPATAAMVATVWCWMVELFQVTGVPAELAARWPAVALVLGVGFDPLDLVWYLVAAVAAACLDWAVWYLAGSHS